jgi:PAS domain S-box-containing protein
LLQDITERKRAESVSLARLRLLEYAATHSLNEVLVATLDELEALTGSQIAFYHFLEADQRTLIMQAWSTRTRRDVCKVESEARRDSQDEASMWMECVRQRRPVIHNDYAALPHKKVLPPGHAPVSRILVAPIFRQAKIVALVGVGNKPRDYDRSDVDLVTHFADLAWDIAERKRVEKALRQSEERLRHVLDGLGPHMFVGLMDQQGTVLLANRSALAAAGLVPDDVQGRPVADTYWWSYSQEVQARLRDAVARVAQGESVRYDEQIRAAEGRLIWIDFSIQPLRDETGRICFLIPSAQVITERKLAEQQLRANREQLAALSRQLFAVQENERRHLARELHDEIGQVMTMISVNLKAVQESAAPVSWPRLDEVIVLVDRLIQQLRDLSLDLRPALLDDFGLDATLRWYVERLRARASFQVDLNSQSMGSEVPTEVRNACFRVAQEALTNVVRHGRARQVRVELFEGEEEVVLTVQDDGVGFDVAAARARAVQGGSVGVLGMQERVELLGGQFTLRSAPGEGTTIQARFIWSADSEESG